MAPRLDPETIERVLRRAQELAGDDTDSDDHTLVDEELLVAAAAEVGIDPTAVRQSLALEELSPTDSQGRLDRLVGPSVVVATRVVPVERDEVLDRLDTWLSASGRLVAIRRTDGSIEWVPRTGVWAALHRFRRPSLARAAEKVDRIVADVEAADDESVVRLAATRGADRENAVGRGAIVSGAGLVGSLAAVTVLVPGFLFVSVPAIAAGGWVASGGRRRADAVQGEIDRLLEVVAAGDRPPSVTDRFRRAGRRDS